jgi:recombinational DNA repair protein (RecF pathway)
MAKKCGICKLDKPDNLVSFQYGRLICSECLPEFKKNAKKESMKISEMI